MTLRLQKLMMLLALLSLSYSTRGLSGAVDIGGGGDALLCKEDASNSFKGYYSLDYFLTFDDSADVYKLVEVTSIQASFERFRKLFAEKLPEFLETFDEFSKNYLNETDFSKRRVWEKSKFGLVDIKDENITARLEDLPKNCLQDGKIKVVQAVVRQWPEFSGRPDKNIVYSYVPEVVKELNSNSPLQLSFLVMHEWLWDLSMNVERNRRVNRFLHSNVLETLSRDELLEQFKGMGLLVPGKSPDVFREDFCSAEPGAGKYWNDRLKVNSLPIMLGQFKVEARNRNCTSVDGCESIWTSTNSRFEEVFGEKPHVTIEESGALLLRSIIPSDFVDHTECRFNIDGIVKCSVLIDRNKDTFQYQPNMMSGTSGQLEFEGTLGRGCLKLQSNQWFSGESVGPGHHSPPSAFRYEDQVVIGVTFKR